MSKASEVLELFELRVQHRKSTPDVRRSQAAKNSWKMTHGRRMKSIKRYHKSSAGRRFHTALGRFNSLRRGMSKAGKIMRLFR